MTSVKNMIICQVKIFINLNKLSVCFYKFFMLLIMLICYFNMSTELVHAWEAAGELPKDSKTRRVVIRSGVVLGRTGGMISQIFFPFFFGVGGPIGSGNQYMPWIHISDLVELFIYSIEQEKVQGILNAVAPQVFICFVLFKFTSYSSINSKFIFKIFFNFLACD